MHRQTASKLLYGALYITINKKEHAKYIIDLNMSKYKSIKTFILFYFIFFFLHYIRMEPTSQNNSINAINDVRTILSELRSNLSCEEINRIRKKLYKKEAICNFLKEKEQKVSLTNKEKKVLKNIDRYLKNISTLLKN